MAKGIPYLVCCHSWLYSLVHIQDAAVIVPMSVTESVMHSIQRSPRRWSLDRLFGPCKAGCWQLSPFSPPHYLIRPLPDTNGFLNEPRTIDSISQLKPNILHPPFTQPLGTQGSWGPVRCEFPAVLALTISVWPSHAAPSHGTWLLQRCWER